MKRFVRLPTKPALTIGLMAFLGAALAHGASEDRLTRSVEGYSARQAERGGATLSELKEQRTAAADVVTKPRSPIATLTLGDQWIYDADAVLFDDFDGDGYYRYLSVRFDADTYLASVYVYAELYLSADGETWEHFYSTEDFLIGGTVPDDEYFVETELLSGYPPALYDVLIELYDADFGTFSDEFGPNETSALSLLPLEDAQFDAPPVPISNSSGGGGGAIGATVLPLLLIAWGFRRRRSATLPGRRDGAAPPSRR